MGKKLEKTSLKDDDLKKIEELDRSLSDGQRFLVHCMLPEHSDDSELIDRLLTDAVEGEVRESDSGHSHEEIGDDSQSDSMTDEFLKVSIPATETEKYIHVVSSPEGFSISSGAIYDFEEFIQSVKDCWKLVEVGDDLTKKKLVDAINSYFKIHIDADNISKIEDLIDQIPKESVSLGSLNLVPSLTKVSLAARQAMEGDEIKSAVFDTEEGQYVPEDDQKSDSDYSLPEPKEELPNDSAIEDMLNGVKQVKDGDDDDQSDSDES